MRKYLLYSVLPILTVILFGGSFKKAYAQPDFQTKQFMDNYRSNKMVTGDWRRDLTLEDIDGSPYLNNEFVPGNVSLVQNQNYSQIPLRYNLFSEVVEFKSADGSVYNFTVPDDIINVEFGGNIFKYVEYQDGKNSKKGYFGVLAEGKATLFVRMRSIYKDAVPPAPYKDAERAKFLREPDTYFVKVGDEPAKYINSKKELIDVFPDNKDKIETFISKNKTKFNKADGITEVVKYYNSL